VKLVNEAGPQQRAVEAASGFRDDTRRSELVLHRAQGLVQVDRAVAGDQVGDVLAAQVGQVRRRCRVRHDDQRPPADVGLAGPPDPAAAVDDGEPAAVALGGQEVVISAAMSPWGAGKSVIGPSVSATNVPLPSRTTWGAYRRSISASRAASIPPALAG
jgi:hypothetical protein